MEYIAFIIVEQFCPETEPKKSRHFATMSHPFADKETAEDWLHQRIQDAGYFNDNLWYKVKCHCVIAIDKGKSSGNVIKMLSMLTAYFGN